MIQSISSGLLVLGAAAVVGCANLARGGDDAMPFGCYVATLGEWTPVPPEVPALQTPPPAFRISRGDGSAGQQAGVLTPTLATPRSVALIEVLPADSLLLRWTGDFFVGVAIRARMFEDSLVGRAQTWTDVRGPERAGAAWRARRVSCG
jgi:hypothetical protein